MTNQSQFGGAGSRGKQWNPGAQQRRYHSNFDAIYEARVKKGAEQVATTEQPNILSALSFQVSHPICIQLRHDSYVGVLLLFESPRENDGSNSGESGESVFTSCLDRKLKGASAHQQRVKLRPKCGEIDFRIRANPVVFSGLLHPRLSSCRERRGHGCSWSRSGWLVRLLPFNRFT